MLALAVTAVGGFFEELGTSIAKKNILAKEAGIYTIGFINTVAGAIILAASVFLLNQSFVFSAASLPTFAPRAFLEILQAYATMEAISRADRSTHGFLRVLTLPLLLLTDAVLGYPLAAGHVIGISFIVFAFIFLFINHGIKKEGSGFALFTALNAVITISLYKYNITHYNSVAGEQIAIFLVLAIYFLLMSLFVNKENPFVAIRRKNLRLQPILHGTGSAVLSFAYALAPASIITSAKRSVEVMWSVFSGSVIFKEKRFAVKAAAFALIAIGVSFLV